MSITVETRAWLGRLLLSALLAIGAGLFAYLLARAATTAYLFYQQQQFFREIATIMQAGSIEELAMSNIRQLRQIVRSLEAQYQQLSIQIGFAVGTVSAVGIYLWIERRRVAKW